MTKSPDAKHVDKNAFTQTDDRSALKISSSDTGQTARKRWVSREQFIQMLLAHHRLVRCDDLESGLRGLMDPTTGDCFYIGEEDLLKPRTA